MLCICVPYCSPVSHSCLICIVGPLDNAHAQAMSDDLHVTVIKTGHAHMPSNLRLSARQLVQLSLSLCLAPEDSEVEVGAEVGVGADSHHADGRSDRADHVTW